MQKMESGDPDDYYLLQLFPEERRTVTETYRRVELAAANADYARCEERVRQGERVQVALVAAGTVEALKQAYPNYFMDTQEFVKILDLIEASALSAM
jgi:putative GTP pyrophosphokinase